MAHETKASTPPRLRWERQTYRPQYSHPDSPLRERFVAFRPEAAYTVEKSGTGWDASLYTGTAHEVLWTWETKDAAQLQCEGHYETLMARLNQRAPVELVEVAS